MNCFEKRGITSPKKLLNYFESNMKYGFKYFKNVFTDSQPDFQENMNRLYKLRIGENFLQSGYGVCWDFCECERLFFEYIGKEHKCFFVETILENGEGGPTHTFALFKENGKWCWFEFAWLAERGIHEFNTIEEAIEIIVKKLVKFCNEKICKVNVFRTEKAAKRMDAFEFVEHCLKGKLVFSRTF